MHSGIPAARPLAPPLAHPARRQLYPSPAASCPAPSSTAILSCTTTAACVLCPATPTPPPQCPLTLPTCAGNSRCLDDNCESCNARKGTPCYKCQEGYVLKEDLGNSYCACEDPACNLCTTNGTCTQCFVGYGLDEEQSCQPCSDSNCSWCGADYQTCTECAMGFSLVDDKCEACPEGCTACNGTQCTECGDGYSLQEGECVAW